MAKIRRAYSRIQPALFSSPIRSRWGGRRQRRIIKDTVPMIFVLIAVLLAVTYIPEIVLFCRITLGSKTIDHGFSGSKRIFFSQDKSGSFRPFTKWAHSAIRSICGLSFFGCESSAIDGIMAAAIGHAVFVSLLE